MVVAGLACVDGDGVDDGEVALPGLWSISRQWQRGRNLMAPFQTIEGGSPPADKAGGHRTFNTQP